MSKLQDVLKIILNFLLQNKKRIFLSILLAGVFYILFFPLDDLNDLIQQKISQASGGATNLQFEHVKFGLSPLGISFDNVAVETTGMRPLRMATLTIAPALSSLWSQKPFGKATAQGFLKGDVEVSLSSGSNTETGIERQRIAAEISNVELGQLKNIFSLPISPSGNLKASLTAQVDIDFKEQPEGDLRFEIQNLAIASSLVQTMLGPLQLPELKFSSADIKGRLSAGRLLIEEIRLGRGAEEVSATIKGQIVLNLIKSAQGIFPQLGTYSFDIDLNAQKSFIDRAGLFLSFIDNVKSPTGTGARYRFRVAGTSFDAPPTISPIR